MSPGSLQCGVDFADVVSSSSFSLLSWLAFTMVGVAASLGILGAHGIAVPLWYQSKGASAARSGIDILPFMLSIVISESFHCILDDSSY